MIGDADPFWRSINSAVADMPALDSYSDRHGVRAGPFLTVTTDYHADLIVQYLRARVAGRTIIEIGGGLGLLACHMALIARRVYCIEANPIWSWSFVCALMATKPKNLSYLFGAADEFAGTIRGDVAIFCTHSDVKGMRAVAGQFAPEVIDIYGEVIAKSPERFDKLARTLRDIA